MGRVRRGKQVALREPGERLAGPPADVAALVEREAHAVRTVGEHPERHGYAGPVARLGEAPRVGGRDERVVRGGPQEDRWVGGRHVELAREPAPELLAGIALAEEVL